MWEQAFITAMREQLHLNNHDVASAMIMPIHLVQGVFMLGVVGSTDVARDQD